MRSKITFGSLFAGIGGFDLGLERAGMTCKWQVEIDDYAKRVLTKHWPNVPKYGDIRDIEHGDLGPVDLICGGFPCQDLSYAGKGGGIEAKRSALWKEYVRIIRLVRPRYVLVENVPALLGRGMGVVLGDLSQSGYDAEWDCIPAAALGAPHRRDRVFLLAYANEQRLEGRDSRILSERSGERVAGEGGTSVDKCSSLGNSRSGSGDGEWWSVEPDLGRLAHGIPKRVDRLKGLGNAVVPQVAEWIGRRIIEEDL